MTSKLKIKLGHVEFEYEGDAAFNHDSIKDLFSHLETIFQASQSAQPPKRSTANGDTKDAEHEPGSGSVGEVVNHPSNVAAHLSVTSGPEMAVAAAAYLQLGQSKETFSRAELLGAMKQATAYYQENYSSNLTAILKRLVLAKKFNQLGSGVYCLNSSERQALETKIAG